MLNAQEEESHLRCEADRNVCPTKGKTLVMARRGRRGFTLLELVLVMILICTALAISAPDLRGFSAGSRMKNAAQQVLALTNYAKTQSAAEGRVYRVNLEGDGYYVSAVDDSGQFQQQGNGLGQVFKLPDGVKAQLTKDDGAGGNYIEFYPDGRTEPGRVRLVSDSGAELYVACMSPSERFRVVSAAAVGGVGR